MKHIISLPPATVSNIRFFKRRCKATGKGARLYLLNTKDYDVLHIEREGGKVRLTVRAEGEGASATQPLKRRACS